MLRALLTDPATGRPNPLRAAGLLLCAAAWASFAACLLYWAAGGR